MELVEINRRIGERIREKRKYLGLNQKELGEKLGITFQQLQKYETGRNNVSASRLYELSIVLGVSINYFFDEQKHTDAPPEQDIDQEMRVVLKAFKAIRDLRTRKKIADLIRGIAD